MATASSDTTIHQTEQKAMTPTKSSRLPPPPPPLDSLAATWRPPTTKGVERPERDIPAFLHQDLYPSRLASIQGHLYWAGRVLPPRALHVHRLMRREIVGVQNVDLHMVWSKGRICIKPLPPYLLDSDFKERYIQTDPVLQSYALGFLFSYIALVATELDLHIAHEAALLPKTLNWSTWKALVEEVDGVLGLDPYAKIAPRYIHGELRLSRLDKVCRLTGQGVVYGFLPETSTALFSEFYADHFGKLAAALVYVALMLTAMQVGLADEYLVGNEAFQRACYGFTIFAMVAPLVIAMVIFWVAMGFFLLQWWKTSREFRGKMGAIEKSKAGGDGGP